MIKTADYQNKTVKVESYPKFNIAIDQDTSEEKPNVVASKAPRYKDLTIIVKPDGMPLYPHNLYLHAQLQKGRDNTRTAAQALMAFERFLAYIGKSYRSLTENQEESPPWLFADFLIDNLIVIDPETGMPNRETGYAISTARTYISFVIDFYKWLHRENIQQIDSNNKPFEFRWVKLSKKSIDHHDMLAHVSGRKAIMVQTTSLMQRFPKIQSTPAWMKLKPITPTDKDIFFNYLSKEKGAGETLSLMCRLSIASGLRVEELASLPEKNITLPVNGQTVSISIGPANGCDTKFDKQRRIEVPYEIMMELHEYKHSSDRKKYLLKRNIELDQSADQKESDNAHGRLFISRSGSAYAPNSIQSFVSKIRKKIQKEYLNWYYRVHDLRSTFAVDWLAEESIKRQVLFDFLLQELSVLMGHESTATTQKYVDLKNARSTQIEHATKKNNVANKSLIGR
jgi:integrase